MVDHKNIREFLRHFFGSRVLQYHVMSEYYSYFNRNSEEIEREIEAHEKKKTIDEKEEMHL